MASIRQASFGGGELDPLLHGRSDLPAFSKGLRTMRNFFASRTGAAVSRPGSLFIGYAGGQSRRLVPFVFSDDQAFVVEITTNGAVSSLRFYAAGGLVETAPGVPYVLASPFSIGNLDELQWAQVGDVMTFTNGATSPFELRRLSNTNWTLSVVSFAERAPAFASPTAGGYPVLLSPLPVPDATHPAEEWIWLATLFVKDVATGRFYQTAAFRISESWDGSLAHIPAALAAGNQVAVYPDKPVTIRRGNHLETSITTPDTTYQEIAMGLYRGKANLFGFVGTTKTDTFVDKGGDPNFAVPPPLGTNPFALFDDKGLPTGFEYPRAVAFFQDKRCFAGSDLRPNTFRASATGDYPNFDPHPIVPVAGQALEFDLASRRLANIVSMAAQYHVLVLTSGSVWSGGGTQGPLDFDSVDFHQIEEIGALPLAPLVIDDAVMYARKKGCGARILDFVANPYGGGAYHGTDATLHAQHLFRGTAVIAQYPYNNIPFAKAIKDWCYAEDPWGVAWVVMNDGALLSYTPMSASSGGWAKHDTAGGIVLAVCAIPEGDEDSVYMLVQRYLEGDAKICIERMTSRVRRRNAEDDACVDCGARYSGAPALTITGLTHLKGQSVWAIAVGNAPQGPFVVSNAGEITLGQLPVANTPAGNVVLFVGLLYTADLETLDVVTTDSKMKPKAVVRVGFEVDQSAGILGGEDFDHLTESRPNTVASGYAAPVPGTELVILTPSRTWGIGGRSVLRQSLPLPVTVVALNREFEIGGP